MPSGGNVVHFGAIRIRAVGTGDLKYQFQGYNDVLLQDLLPHRLDTTNSRELTRLANFNSQAGKLKIFQDVRNQVMRVNHLIIFVKQIWTDYPS